MKWNEQNEWMKWNEMKWNEIDEVNEWMNYWMNEWMNGMKWNEMK